MFRSISSFQVGRQQESVLFMLQEEAVSEGPLAVLDFWNDRLSDLQSLQAQITSQPVQDALMALSATGCSYLPSFRGLASFCFSAAICMQ